MTDTETEMRLEAIELSLKEIKELVSELSRDEKNRVQSYATSTAQLEYIEKQMKDNKELVEEQIKEIKERMNNTGEKVVMYISLSISVILCVMALISKL